MHRFDWLGKFGSTTSLSNGVSQSATATNPNHVLLISWNPSNGVYVSAPLLSARSRRFVSPPSQINTLNGSSVVETTQSYVFPPHHRLIVNLNRPILRSPKCGQAYEKEPHSRKFAPLALFVFSDFSSVCRTSTRHTNCTCLRRLLVS